MKTLDKNLLIVNCWLLADRIVLWQFRNKWVIKVHRKSAKIPSCGVLGGKQRSLKGY